MMTVYSGRRRYGTFTLFKSKVNARCPQSQKFKTLCNLISDLGTDMCYGKSQ